MHFFHTDGKPLRFLPQKALDPGPPIGQALAVIMMQTSLCTPSLSGAAIFASAMKSPDKACSFVGRVVDCAHPTIGPDDQCAFEVTIEPLRGGARFTTAPFSDPELYSAAFLAMETGAHVQVRGTLGAPQGQGQAKSKARRPVAIDVQSLRGVYSQIELVTPPADVIDRARQLIEELRQRPGAIEEFLLAQGYAFFDQVRSSRSGRLRMCERAVLLQNLSAGQVNPLVNPRISLLAVSKPGNSKKLMSHLALLYAPLGQLIQPGMMSVAGLGAAVHQKKGGFTSRRGALPNCHKGVAVVEDIHRVSRKLLPDFQAGIMGVAEDGVTIQTKASTDSFVAHTALHLNTNLQSVVHARLRAAGVTAKLHDLGLPADLLSRMDIIIELTVGDTAGKQAREIVVQQIRKPTPERDAERAEQALLLKTMMALLIDRYEEIRFDGLETELQRLMDDITLVIGHFSAKMTEEQQALFDGETLLRRIANSIRKLVSASARLSARDHITQEDIDTAWDMLSYKLEIIRWLCDDSAGRVRTLRSRQEIVAEAQQASNDRWAAMVERYGGRNLALCQIAVEMDLAVRTVGRELEARGYHPHFGVAWIPTLAEETERVLRREPPAAAPPGYTEEHHLLPDGVSAEQAVAAAPDPTPQVVLDPPDADMNRVVAALQTEMLARQSDNLTRYLLKAGFDYQAGPTGTCLTTEVIRHMASQALAGTEENRRVLGVLRDRLNDPDDLRRGRTAVQLITFAGWDVPTYEYRDLLRRETLPQELRAALVSILTREQWQKDQAKLRKQQEERAAHLLAESRILV